MGLPTMKQLMKATSQFKAAGQMIVSSADISATYVTSAYADATFVKSS